MMMECHIRQGPVVRSGYNPRFLPQVCCQGLSRKIRFPPMWLPDDWRPGMVRVGGMLNSWKTVSLLWFDGNLNHVAHILINVTSFVRVPLSSTSRKRNIYKIVSKDAFRTGKLGFSMEKTQKSWKNLRTTFSYDGHWNIRTRPNIILQYQAF